MGGDQLKLILGDHVSHLVFVSSVRSKGVVGISLRFIRGPDTDCAVGLRGGVP